MLVQHFPINPDTYGNVGKSLNNILIYGCSPIQGNIFNFTPFMFMFLSKTVSNNLSLVNRAPLNKCKKKRKKYFVLVKKVIKMSESVKKR